MKLLTIVFLTCFSINGFAQTKLIAHRSHSGSNSNFRKAFEHNLFDIGQSNFGLHEIVHTKLDSVIYLSEKNIILVTTQQRYIMGSERKAPWTQSRSMISAHRLFFKNHSLDSIKTQLKTEKYYVNNIDSVVFVGYDNKKHKTNKR